MKKFSFSFLSRVKPKPGSSRIHFLGENKDLDSYTQDQTGVILGALVIMQRDQPPAASDNYLVQPVRQSRRTDLSLTALRTQPVSIFNALSSDLTKYFDGKTKRKHKLLLASDAVLKLAKRRKGPVLIICNGYHAHDCTYFDTYIFLHGQLVQLNEAVIKSAGHIRYGQDVRDQLNPLLATYPDAKVLWTPPLIAPTGIEQHFAIQFEDDDIYRVSPLAAFKLNHGQSDRSSLIPFYIVLVSMGLCSLWTINGMRQLSALKQHYLSITSQQQVLPTASLETLQKRAEWQAMLDEGKTVSVSQQQTEETLLQAVASHPDWRVISIDTAAHYPDQVAAPSGQSEPQPSLSLKISVPINADNGKSIDGALEQAHPVVSSLSAAIRLPLSVAAQGIQSDQANQRLLLTLNASHQAD